MIHLNKLFGFVACGFIMMTACSNSEPEDKPGDKPNPPTDNTGDVVEVLTTNGSLSFNLNESTVKLSSGETLAPTKIAIDPTQRLQQIDGFGAAVTGSTCFNLLEMDQADRTKFLTETFSPDKYNFNYIRISIGCSDFSLSDYTCCDKKGIENFGLTKEENEYVIPILKEILAINPNVKIMGTPWTAPKWMKVNNLNEMKPFDSWTSGQLNPAYYQDYAQYFVKWIKAFEQQGIKIYSVTPQNEPLNHGNSASMYMSWEEERDFVKTALGPALKQAGLNTKIYAFDHNYNYDNVSSQKSYPLKIYADKEAAQYFAGAAYHNYGGDRSELLNIHNAAPEKELVFSETSIGTWNDGRNVAKRLVEDMWEIALGTVNNWCRGSIVWNLMLDNNRGPHGGPGACATCYGAVDINDDYKTITKNSHYYIMAQMGFAVQADAYRVKTSDFKNNNLQYAAFVNPDGSYGFVIANKGEAQTITITCNGKYFTASVPANGVASYRWK